MPTDQPLPRRCELCSCTVPAGQQVGRYCDDCGHRGVRHVAFEPEDEPVGCRSCECEAFDGAPWARFCGECGHARDAHVDAGELVSREAATAIGEMPTAVHSAVVGDEDGDDEHEAEADVDVEAAAVATAAAEAAAEAEDVAASGPVDDADADSMSDAGSATSADDDADSDHDSASADTSILAAAEDLDVDEHTDEHEDELSADAPAMPAASTTRQIGERARPDFALATQPPTGPRKRGRPPGQHAHPNGSPGIWTSVVVAIALLTAVAYILGSSIGGQGAASVDETKRTTVDVTREEKLTEQQIHALQQSVEDARVTVAATAQARAASAKRIASLRRDIAALEERQRSQERLLTQAKANAAATAASTAAAGAESTAPGGDT